MAAKSVTILPNLVLSTTYAINKSCTKRAIVGLELNEETDTFRPVIKLSGSGPPNKYVTLDMNTWEVILDQMDTIKNYLSDGYAACYEDFGVPSVLLLKNHSITFTTCHEEKAICIAERSPVNIAATVPPAAAADGAPVTSSSSTENNATTTSATGIEIKNWLKNISLTSYKYKKFFIFG